MLIAQPAVHRQLSGAATSITTSRVMRMHHAGHGAVAAVFHVGHGAGNRAGGGHAAEEGGDEVGNALGHQFLVGIVAVAVGAVGHHLVGNAGAQQRFNRAQQSQRGGGDEQELGGVPTEGSGHAKAGKLLGMLPKREAMVSTSSPIILAATVAPTNTTIEPGMVEKLLVLGMVSWPSAAGPIAKTPTRPNTPRPSPRLRR